MLSPLFISACPMMAIPLMLVSSVNKDLKMKTLRIFNTALQENVFQADTECQLFTIQIPDGVPSHFIKYVIKACSALTNTTLISEVAETLNHA